MNTTLETKLNQLAADVIPADGLESFLQLPIESQIVGLKVFAAIGGDQAILEALEEVAA